tara:strand:+ start:2936 stop:5068 length:2133 start_codon:yes stop_codon:yes gene_type:complete
MPYKKILKNHYDSFLLLCFTLVFLLFFFLSDGLFYGFDSNETFSSIWHSFNFLNYSFDLHKGLADETFSNLASAHSFIHTHQGNVPRILGILLILIGFESVQSHVIITFLILGLPTFYFLIKLLHKISNSKEYTYISIIFLFTNYILFFQWLFVTYRIWYFYLIFSSIYYIIQLDNKRVYKFLLFLNLVFLYYFELIFALYLSLVLFFFILYLNNFSIKNVIKKYHIFLLAPIISLLVLSSQLILFYGVDSFIQDINYTFKTRNTSLNINDQILNFYNKYFIVYWHNFLDQDHSFFKVFLKNDFKFYGLYFISIIAYGFLIPIKIYFSSFIDSQALSKKRDYLKHRTTLIVSVVFLLVLINNFIIFYAHNSSIVNINIPIYIIFSITLSLFVIYYIYNHKIYFYKFIIFYLFLILFSSFILFLKSYMSHNNLDLFTGSVYSIILILFINLITFTSLKNISNIKIKYKNLFYLFLSFFVSIVIIYFLSPGYLWSGYVDRAAPFLIFAKFIFYGFSLFFIYHLLSKTSLSENFLLRFLSYALAATIIYIWLYSQYYLIKTYKYDNYSFLSVMHQKKYNNKKIISNFYPASYTFISKSSGFHDDLLTDREIIILDNKFYLTVDDKYLWLRGKKENYSMPDYLICNTNNIYATSNINYKKVCSNFDLIKNIDNYDFANIIEAEFFEDSNQQYYRWVIVEFDYSKNFGGLNFVKK